ncbi:MAG: class I SAM-dependent methyltransferase [Anaerolineales bacterium]|nr:class I SAM-dependent methyltransferase [Anaerolineales bacterium]
MKDIIDIITRSQAPEAWGEGEKIAWENPNFSKRILREHLSQEHDEASRRSELIDEHVRWIHEVLLRRKPARVLDLCCGPGFYTSRLASLGHTCSGIDYSPAAIGYARQVEAESALGCSYIQEDIRTAAYGKDNDLLMILFGELNVFKKEDTQQLIQKAYQALKPGGILLLEPHSFSAVQEIGEQAPSWYSEESGLFSEKPHIVLSESYWDAKRNIASTRHFIVDAKTTALSQQSENIMAYTKKEYKDLLEMEGFQKVKFHRSFGDALDEDFFVITTIK